MRKVMWFLVIFVLCFWECGFTDIVWQDISAGKSHITAILVDCDNPDIIYIGTKDGVYKTEGSLSGWRNILSSGGQNKTVNLLLSDPQDKNSLYSAGANGLFYSANQGRDWRRIFKGRDYLSNECTALAVSPQGIYLGTKSGVFFSRDKGRSWHKESGVLGKSQILAIAYDSEEPGCIYVASTAGVFRSKDSQEAWERISIAIAVENEDASEESSEGLDEQELFSKIRHITVDSKTGYFYLATSGGVYESRDKGLTLSPLSDYGLLSREVKFLVVSSKSGLYAVTKSGIFEYTGERWQELSFGLPASDIRFLALDNQDNLYAACDNGLFKAVIKPFINNRESALLDLYYKDEPEIEEVQQAAIRYAEVEPEKIQQWRGRAAKGALLPQLSIGIDRNTTDLWHWEGGSTTKSDDDVLKRGRDSVDWDVSLTWDLSEVIWNSDQTSIDARSRLMVQLRDDILDEINKIYFERLRVKIDLDCLTIEERKKRLEKELRLQELTASLDGLTGGYFSSQIK